VLDPAGWINGDAAFRLAPNIRFPIEMDDIYFFVIVQFVSIHGHWLKVDGLSVGLTKRLLFPLFPVNVFFQGPTPYLYTLCCLIMNTSAEIPVKAKIKLFFSVCSLVNR